MRRSLLVVALIACTAVPVIAQTIDGAATGVRQSSAVSMERSPRVVAAPQDSTTARRSVAPYLLIGALAGGLVGFLLEEDFHDDFCTPGPGVSCSSDYDGIGVVIGAGLGALAGLIVYAITGPPPSSVPTSP